MENLDKIDIQTTSSEGQSIQTVVNNGPINLTTQVSDVPQIQTVMQENVSPISSIINNPFVEVTSVNGQTGDVITEPVMEDFRTNHYYLKNTIVNYNENIYWSKATFTSGNSFNINDWNKVDITYNTNWDDITNKPSFSNVATSGNYGDLNNLPTIGNGTLTIQTNGVNIDTFTANATNNKTINISVPVSTSQLTNDSGFIKTVDSLLDVTSSNPVQNKVVTQSINDINTLVNDKISYGNVQSTDIVANAVTTAKITDEAVTSAKMNWASAKADPDVGDGLGWVYLGQTRLTAAASSLTFTFPKKYDNYKIMFGGEFASGSGTWIDLRLLNGSTAIVGGHQVQDATGTGWAAAVNENVSFHLNSGNCYTYEAVNIDFYSFKTATSQWRKFQGHLYKVGNSYTVRTSNGRLGSTTEPTAVQIITGGTLAFGATIKVWGSDNT